MQLLQEHCLKYKSNISSTSPAINSVLLILFIFAFSFAASIASSTISIPYTSFTLSLKNIPIDPTPLYKSNITSLPTKFKKIIDTVRNLGFENFYQAGTVSKTHELNLVVIDKSNNPSMKYCRKIFHYRMCEFG